MVSCAGSQEMQACSMNVNICSNHEVCEGRSSQFKLTKGFTAKESVKGHMASSSFTTISTFFYFIFNKEERIQSFRNPTSLCIKKKAFAY